MHFSSKSLNLLKFDKLLDSSANLAHRCSLCSFEKDSHSYCFLSFACVEGWRGRDDAQDSPAIPGFVDSLIASIDLHWLSVNCPFHSISRYSYLFQL